MQNSPPKVRTVTVRLGSRHGSRDLGDVAQNRAKFGTAAGRTNFVLAFRSQFRGSGFLQDVYVYIYLSIDMDIYIYIYIYIYGTPLMCIYTYIFRV